MLALLACLFAVGAGFAITTLIIGEAINIILAMWAKRLDR